MKDQRTGGAGQEVQQIHALRRFLIHGQYRGHPDHQQTSAADPEPGQHTADQPREDGTQKRQHTISRTPPAKITPPRIRCSAFAGIFRNQSPASTPPAAPPIR